MKAEGLLSYIKEEECPSSEELEPPIRTRLDYERIEQLLRRAKYLKGKANTYKRLLELEEIITELETF